MQRRWTVYPRPGEAEVNREDMAAAFLDGEAIIARCGGHMSVVTQRQSIPEIPGAAFTVGAIFEWKDRTDARAQPERTVSEVPQPDPDPAPDPEPDEIGPPEPVPADYNPDGFEPLAEVDESSIPVGRR